MKFDISVLKTSTYNEFIISVYKLFLMSNCSSKTGQEFCFYLKVKSVQLDFLPLNFLWFFSAIFRMSWLTNLFHVQATVTHSGQITSLLLLWWSGHVGFLKINIKQLVCSSSFSLNPFVNQLILNKITKLDLVLIKMLFFLCKDESKEP